MSAEFISGFCRGYVITDEEYSNILPECFDDWSDYDDFCDDYVRMINSWGDGSEGYFVGCDKRYFIDETVVFNSDDIVKTFESIKIDLFLKVIKDNPKLSEFFSTKKIDCFYIHFCF